MSASVPGYNQLDYESFVASTRASVPPVGANAALRALWHDANGNTESALRAALADDSHSSLRARAYLHRKAGDTHAARRAYWLCGTTAWDGDFASEWEDIVRSVLVEVVVERSYL